MEEIKDLINNNKESDNQNENIDDNNKISTKDIEKNYYSKFMYKRFLKLKKKGLDYGITLPNLKYPLDKPNSPRLAFKITSFVMLALSVIVLSLSIYLLVKCRVLSMFGELISNTKSVFTEKAFEESLGLSSIASIGVFWLYLLCGVLIILPIVVVGWLLYTARKNWILSQVSRQEMAKGYEVKRYIVNTFILLGITAVFLIVLLVKSSLSVIATRILFITGMIIFIYLIANIVILKHEKQKDEIWFKTLPIEKQQDFINQNKSMKKILILKRR